MDTPDEIYLVETHTNPWWVWLMKRDNNHWSSGGMPSLDQTIYEPDSLPTAGMSKEYRETFSLGPTKPCTSAGMDARRF